MKINFAGAALPKSGILVVFAEDGGKLLPLGALADKRSSGHLSKAIKAAKFEGKRDSVLDCLVPGGGFDRILIVGVGAADSLGAREVELLGGVIAGALQGAKAKTASIAVELPAKSNLKPGDAAALIASVPAFESIVLTATNQKPERTAHSMVTLLCSEASKAKSPLNP
jgi:leucyl aminopeptidase